MNTSAQISFSKEDLIFIATGGVNRPSDARRVAAEALYQMGRSDVVREHNQLNTRSVMALLAKWAKARGEVRK